MKLDSIVTRETASLFFQIAVNTRVRFRLATASRVMSTMKWMKLLIKIRIVTMSITTKSIKLQAMISPMMQVQQN